jgi:hypothetical protein
MNNSMNNDKNQSKSSSSQSNPDSTLTLTPRQPQVAKTVKVDISGLETATNIKPYSEALKNAKDQQKVEEHLRNIDKKVSELDNKIEINKYRDLQVKKSEKLRKDRIYTFMILIKPCIVLEIIIAILSLNFEFLQIPPWDGPGLLLNLIILIIGILIGLVGFIKGYKITKKLGTRKSKGEKHKTVNRIQMSQEASPKTK